MTSSERSEKPLVVGGRPRGRPVARRYLRYPNRLGPGSPRSAGPAAPGHPPRRPAAGQPPARCWLARKSSQVR